MYNFYYEGYITDNHPTVPGEDIEVNMCYDYSGWSKPCYNWGRHKINITKCDGYFVYYLPGTTGCSARYCTDD